MTFNIGQKVLFNGKPSFITRELVYKLPNGKNPFGLYYRISQVTSKGKVESDVHESQISATKEDININFILSEN